MTLWVVEMWERDRWSPTVGVSLNRADERLRKLDQRGSFKNLPADPADDGKG